MARVEDQAELLKAAPQSEAYAVTNFAVELTDSESGPKRVTIALPLAGLEPAFEAFSGSIHKAEIEEHPASIGDHLLDAAVEVSLRFGPMALRASDVAGFAEGQVVLLRHRTATPLAVDVEGVPFLSAKPGRIGRRLACVIVDPTIDLGATAS